MFILKFMVLTIRFLLWYALFGGTFYMLTDYTDHDFLEELASEMEGEYPQISGNHIRWLVTCVIVIVWPLLLALSIKSAFRKFFASCNRSLIDIFSKKKGAQNETHGKNQEDPYKE